jgi:hypothetical protein
MLRLGVWWVQGSPNRGREPEGEEAEDAAEWVRGKLGLYPDEKQALVLRSASKRGLLNCTRQWGKSTIAAAKAVHEAVRRPGSLILVVSPTARQSGELVRKAAEFAQRLGMRTKGDGTNENSLEFANRSRIIGLPGSGDTIRGFSAVTLLLVDEAARVPDEVYMAVLPMLAVSGGGLWLMSTPNGKRGFFWEAWERGEPEWEKVAVTAYDCPRIGREALEEDRRTMGERRFQQEYMCEFGETEGGVFGMDVVERAFTREAELLVIDLE